MGVYHVCSVTWRIILIIETKKDLVEDLEKLKQEQKKEIEAMRNRLLMLFVQELRTPLSLIIAPLKELQKDDSQTSQLSLQVAYRNSLRMVDACDQLLAVYGQGNMESKLEVARIRWIK